MTAYDLSPGAYVQSFLIVVTVSKGHVRVKKKNVVDFNKQVEK